MRKPKEDSRIRAVSMIRSAASRAERSVFAYGTRQAVFLLLGAKSSLSIQGPLIERRDGKGARCQYSRAPQQEISEFLQKHRGSFIGGYLGFDLHYASNGLTAFPRYVPTKLIVPEAVLCIEGDSARCVQGNLGGLDLETGPLAEGWSSRSSRELYREPEGGGALYRERVRRILDWIGNSAERRCTIARKVKLPPDIPLDLSFGAGDAQSPMARSFYYSGRDLAFVGTSPELLYEGTAARFRTHKLSGTTARSEDPAEDSRLLESMASEGKIRREHELSARGMVQALERIGDVTRQSTRILTLSNLRHMMTSFETRTWDDGQLTRGVMAVLPTGVSDLNPGLSLIADAEAESRGAYYGLVGLIRPQGYAEFSQLLRAVFRCSGETFAWAGAAITRESVPEEEYEETCLKLGNIHLAERLSTPSEAR